MTGLTAVAASQAGVFTIMLPISSALTGVFALDESLTAGQLLAFSVALAGLVISTLPKSEHAAPVTR
jgi:drug/metabolite transporter (DMT)-like permease